MEFSISGEMSTAQVSSTIRQNKRQHQRSSSRWPSRSPSHLSMLVAILLVSLPWTRAQDPQYYRFTGTMDLSPISQSADLSPAAIVEWETATSQFYVDALLARTDLDPPISNPEVDVSLLFAAPPEDDNTGTVLAMQYRATASFVSEGTDYDPGFLALPSFRDQDTVLQYVLGLRGSGYAVFEGLTALSLSVQSSNPIPAPTPRPASPPPTQGATSAPSRAPVVVTPSPVAPSVSLTEAPTGAPVVTPTTSNTPSPSEAPVISPATDDPSDEENTEEPTPALVQPTQFPTPPPATPAPGLKTQFTTTELLLLFVPGVMEGDVLDDWTRATETYLTDYIQALESDLLSGSSVQIGQITQVVVNDGRLLRRQSRRHLQENITIPLSVEFVSRLDLPPTLDASSLVNGAFLTRSRREAYRIWIQDAVAGSSAEVFFQPLVEVRFYDDNNPNGLVNPESAVGDGSDGGSSGALIGGIVGGLLLLLVAGLFIYQRSSRSSHTGKDTTSSGGNGSDALANQTQNVSPTSQGGYNKSDSAAHNTGLTWEPAEQPSRLNQEIVVGDSMDDVSTIGDPYLYGQPSSIQEDERTATTSVFQTETYNSLLGRQRTLSHGQSMRSTADETEFSAFTGASKYLGHGSNYHPPRRSVGLLGELGIAAESDETSFEQRLFPMDKEDDEGRSVEERSLDYSLPTALM